MIRFFAELLASGALLASGYGLRALHDRYRQRARERVVRALGGELPDAPPRVAAAARAGMLTMGGVSDSIGGTMASETERLRRVRWCDCGQPWLPAAGLYGTTEETRCHGCVLREKLRSERGGASSGGPDTVVKTTRGAWVPYTESRQAFFWVIDECQRYAEAHPEHAAAVLHIATRVAQEARR